MSWLLLTFLSALTGSFSRILQRVLLKDEQSDPFAFGFVFQLCVSALFFLYTLLTRSFEFPNISDLALNILVMMVFYSLGNLCVFKAFKYAEASEVSIVFASSTIWSVLSALYLLKEQLNFQQSAGIGLIVAGVIAVNYSRTSWKVNKGHLFALVGAVLFGIAFTNDAYIIDRYNSIASYMTLAFLLPGLFTLVYSPKSIKHIPHFLSVSMLKKFLLCCVFYALSAVTIFTAFKLGGKASVISPIQQTSIIFTVVLSYVLLKERDRIPNKIIGALLAFAGVVLLI